MPSHSRALAGVPTGQQWSPLSPSVPQAPPRRTYPRPVPSWQRTGFPPVGRGLQLVLALCFAWMLGAFLVQFVDGLSARSQPDTTTIDSTDFSDSTEASTSPPVPEPASTELTAGQTILPGGAIRTRAGSGLYMQRDGNLVLRNDDGTVTWSSGTAGTGPAFATMQADGNLVVRPASGGAAVWSTKTAGHPSAAVRLQAGTLVVVTPDGQVVWDARTAPP